MSSSKRPYCGDQVGCNDCKVGETETTRKCQSDRRVWNQTKHGRRLASMHIVLYIMTDLLTFTDGIMFYMRTIPTSMLITQAPNSVKALHCKFIAPPCD